MLITLKTHPQYSSFSLVPPSPFQDLCFSKELLFLKHFFSWPFFRSPFKGVHQFHQMLRLHLSAHFVRLVHHLLTSFVPATAAVAIITK
jgi:hypothetical protein